MDKFRRYSSRLSMSYDLFDTIVHRTHRGKKNRSTEKHIARKLSRRKLKNELVREITDL